MNKLVIFDLDGVILDSRELHYNALNSALAKVGKQYVISREEHLSVYDGLNTTKKLKMLSEIALLLSSESKVVPQLVQKVSFQYLII